MSEITYTRVPFRNLVCPDCKEMGTMRRRLMGMPGADFNHERYSSGGCMVSPGCDPDGTTFSMDMEIQFMIPESEYQNVKELFNITADVEIEDAIEQISGSEFADDFCDSLNSLIKVVDRNVWIAS